MVGRSVARDRGLATIRFARNFHRSIVRPVFALLALKTRSAHPFNVASPNGMRRITRCRNEKSRPGATPNGFVLRLPARPLRFRRGLGERLKVRRIVVNRPLKARPCVSAPRQWICSAMQHCRPEACRSAVGGRNPTDCARLYLSVDSSVHRYTRQHRVRRARSCQTRRVAHFAAQLQPTSCQ